ncbi:MAG: CheY-P phosphatase CheC [Candidatus Heimdallarchaeota archaeon LC_3]|nr:MAG: CheY-P phosphatase CheC [Candidatus Heimdallarchaeota archaeon LC_3]
MNSSNKTFRFDLLLSDHIDALQELGNIGSGHAANALADLLNRRIDMSLPRFKRISTTELSTIRWKDKEPDSIFGAVIIETNGEIPLTIIIIFDEDTLNSLLKILSTTKKAININELTSLDESIIKEIGNMLSLHFIASINTFLGINEIPGTPIFVLEKCETIFTSLASLYGDDFTELLLIECDIFSADTKLSPIIIFAPEPKSVEITLLKMFEN